MNQGNHEMIPLFKNHELLLWGAVPSWTGMSLPHQLGLQVNTPLLRASIPTHSQMCYMSTTQLDNAGLYTPVLGSAAAEGAGTAAAAPSSAAER
jgi:hypothetical protein